MYTSSSSHGSDNDGNTNSIAQKRAEKRRFEYDLIILESDRSKFDKKQEAEEKMLRVLKKQYDEKRFEIEEKEKEFKKNEERLRFMNEEIRALKKKINSL